MVRPALELAPTDIEEAFAALLAGSEDAASLASEDFFALLAEAGEGLSEDELARALSGLMGEEEKLSLPQRINAEVFAEEIVGLAE